MHFFPSNLVIPLNVETVAHRWVLKEGFNYPIKSYFNNANKPDHPVKLERTINPKGDTEVLTFWVVDLANQDPEVFDVNPESRKFC